MSVFLPPSRQITSDKALNVFKMWIKTVGCRHFCFLWFIVWGFEAHLLFFKALITAANSRETKLNTNWWRKCENLEVKETNMILSSWWRPNLELKEKSILDLKVQVVVVSKTTSDKALHECTFLPLLVHSFWFWGTFTVFYAIKTADRQS